MLQLKEAAVAAWYEAIAIAITWEASSEQYAFPSRAHLQFRVWAAPSVMGTEHVEVVGKEPHKVMPPVARAHFVPVLSMKPLSQAWNVSERTESAIDPMSVQIFAPPAVAAQT
jgi:hypothetical protein